MATRFVVRQKEGQKPEKIVSFWLEQEGSNGICLMGQAPGESPYAIFTIKPGGIYANICVDRQMELPLDVDGRVIVSTTPTK